MEKLKIAIGADHRGFAMKKFIIEEFNKQANQNIQWIDVGAYNDERSDYPVYAIKAVKAMMADNIDYAVLLCGTGTGMALTANRFSGIYACNAWDETIARLNKEDDNCNVLAMPSDFVSNEEAINIIDAWLKAEFKQGRYEKRIELIDQISI